MVSSVMYLARWVAHLMVWTARIRALVRVRRTKPTLPRPRGLLPPEKFAVGIWASRKEGYASLREAQIPTYQRWPGLSEHRFAICKWNLYRVCGWYVGIWASRKEA